MSHRRGFALHVVLWVMLAAAAVSMAGAVLGRDEFNAARNRLSLERAHWTAAACAERAHAVVDDLLSSRTTSDDPTRVWRDLGGRVDTAGLLQNADCTVLSEAAGTRVDINAATPEVLGAILGSLQGASALVDSIVARRARQPFADAHELRRVSRMFDTSAVRELIATEPGRIALNSAPPAVLAAIPGFTDEVVTAIVDARQRGEPIADLVVLIGRVSSSAAAAVLARYPDVARMTTVDPDAWVITSIGRAPASPVQAFIELRLVRTDRRAVVARYRSWP